MFEFSRDLCGYHYLDKSTLNMQMSEFYERMVHAWFKTRHTHRKRVKVMWLIPRKGRKSTIVTQAGPAYLLAHDPNLAILLDSEQKQRSNDFLGATARIVSGEAPTPWVDYIGSWKSPKYKNERQWREDRIVISPRTYVQRKEPSIVTCSVEIGYTGGAPDVVQIDDPMSPESHTEVWMKAVIKHYEGLGPILMPNGLMILCMTRYDDMDLAGHIERTEGWHTATPEEAEACVMNGQCTQATPAHPEPWHVMFRAAEDSDGNSIDEVVWPTSFLHAEKKKYPGFYAAQYMNDPWHNPDASFQKEDFVYAKETPRDSTCVLTSDIAWKTPTDKKTERGGDWNVFITGRHEAQTGKVYVTGVKRERWTQGEWGDELVRILRHQRKARFPVARMTYEELRGGGAGAMETAIRAACSRWDEMAPALVKAPRSTSPDAKIERVKATAQYFQNHQVVFVRPCGITEYNHNCTQCAGFQVLRNELLKHGATMHDDCADSMADHFIPGVYHAAPVHRDHRRPTIMRPYDDVLKPNFAKQSEMTMVLDENDCPTWIPNDRYYRGDPL